jgi:protein involved in polysaccharide export with SLBB domain
VNSKTRLATLVALLAAAFQTPAVAQLDASQTMRLPYATREQLVSAQNQFQQAAESPAYTVRLRARASGAGADVARRLREGDMRFGDRIVLAVIDQPTLSDTFSVTIGRRLELPGLRPIDLTGVLRSELDARLAQAVREVYRNAEVRTQALMLVGVLGAVARPGYYYVPPEALLEEVVMAAGGFSSEATARLAVERGDSVVLRESDTDLALRAGRNLGSLGLSSGDAIVVRREVTRDFYNVMRTVSMAIGLPAALIATVSIFR